DAGPALALCDEAIALLTRLDQQHGLIGQSVLAQRASVLHALGRHVEARDDIEQALAMWHQLAPAGHLHRIELLDGLASILTSLGEHREAQQAAHRATLLIKNPSLIEPALLARIDTMAKAVP